MTGLEALPASEGLRVLVVGDVAVEAHVVGVVITDPRWGSAPLVQRKREKRILGGAAQVAGSIVALGARCTLLSVAGQDADQVGLSALLASEASLDSVIELVEERKTPTVTHVFADAQEVICIVDAAQGPILAETEQVLISYMLAHLHEHDAVVLVDCDTGVLSDRVIMASIGLAQAADIPVIASPSRNNPAAYADVAVLVQDATSLGEGSDRYLSEKDAAIQAAGLLSGEAGGAAVLLTHGKRDMTLFTPGSPAVHFGRPSSPPFDGREVTNTLIAGLATAIGAGLPLDRAAHIAAIGSGFAAVRDGLDSALTPESVGPLVRSQSTRGNPSVFTSALTLESHILARRAGRRIGFTNGVFDLLHSGHLSSLREARSYCDLLVVGINSDASTRRLKGEGRPINDQFERAELLLGLAVVDAVCVFDEETPLNIIEHLRPDVFVKGADYSLDQLVGRELVESYGGEVVLSRFVNGLSSSRIIAKARRPSSVASGRWGESVLA